MQYAVGLSLLLLVVVVYVPFLQVVFGTVPLSIGDWAMLLPFILAASVAAEIYKAIVRRTSKPPSPAAAGSVA
jgi:Ca2+-transporting ATPase